MVMEEVDKDTGASRSKGGSKRRSTGSKKRKADHDEEEKEKQKKLKSDKSAAARAKKEAKTIVSLGNLDEFQLEQAATEKELGSDDEEDAELQELWKGVGGEGKRGDSMSMKERTACWLDGVTNDYTMTLMSLDDEQLQDDAMVKYFHMMIYWLFWMLTNSRTR